MTEISARYYEWRLDIVRFINRRIAKTKEGDRAPWWIMLLYWIMFPIFSIRRYIYGTVVNSITGDIKIGNKWIGNADMLVVTMKPGNIYRVDKQGDIYYFHKITIDL